MELKPVLALTSTAYTRLENYRLRRALLEAEFRLWQYESDREREHLLSLHGVPRELAHRYAYDATQRAFVLRPDRSAPASPGDAQEPTHV